MSCGTASGETPTTEHQRCTQTSASASPGPSPANRRSAAFQQLRQSWVTNGPQDQTQPTSVDPPIPDEIAATRKSAVPCQEQTYPIAQSNLTLRNLPTHSSTKARTLFDMSRA
jgi:hypothetical protein